MIIIKDLIIKIDNKWKHLNNWPVPRRASPPKIHQMQPWDWFKRLKLQWTGEFKALNSDALGRAVIRSTTSKTVWIDMLILSIARSKSTNARFAIKDLPKKFTYNNTKTCTLARDLTFVTCQAVAWDSCTTLGYPHIKSRIMELRQHPWKDNHLTQKSIKLIEI